MTIQELSFELREYKEIKQVEKDLQGKNFDDDQFLADYLEEKTDSMDQNDTDDMNSFFYYHLKACASHKTRFEEILSRPSLLFPTLQ